MRTPHLAIWRLPSHERRCAYYRVSRRFQHLLLNLRSAQDANGVPVPGDDACNREQSLRLAAWTADRRVADRLTIAAKMGVSQIYKARFVHDGSPRTRTVQPGGFLAKKYPVGTTAVWLTEDCQTGDHQFDLLDPELRQNKRSGMTLNSGKLCMAHFGAPLGTRQYAARVMSC